MQPHIQRTGGFLEQPGELQFGGAHFRVGPVVDQTDMQGATINAPPRAQREFFHAGHADTASAAASKSKPEQKTENSERMDGPGIQQRKSMRR